ncbi:hypothetical protein [Desulfuromonas carbonis]
MKPLRGLFLFLLTSLLLAATGCGRPAKTPETKGRIGYEIDATLGFAIEHPQSWIRSVQPDRNRQLPTVSWSAPGASPTARLDVTSLATGEAIGGFDRLFALFRAAHPDFTLTAREPVELEAPAEKISGATPERSFEVALITGRSRAFILAFSAPQEEFAEQRKIFQGMLDSFRILP